MHGNAAGQLDSLEQVDLDQTTEHRELTRSAARGLSWSGATLLARTILNIFVTAVLARLLSPQEYGVVGAALIVGAFGN
ncbi:MAG: hypothetical protein E5Y67_35125, partial [Mesorhizobium sp.]